MEGVELMAAIPTVLLPLASCAIHEALLRAVVHGIDGGIDQSLQRWLRNAYNRNVRPGEYPPPHTHAGNGNLAGSTMNVQLHPTATLKIKCFKVVDALAADEASPAVKVRVKQRRATHLMRFLYHQFNGSAGRSIYGEIGPTYHLVFELECQCRPAVAIELYLPWSLANFFRQRLPVGAKTMRRQKFKIFLRRTIPLNPK